MYLLKNSLNVSIEVKEIHSKLFFDYMMKLAKRSISDFSLINIERATHITLVIHGMLS